MDFEQLAKIEKESERVNRTYDIFNEDARLNHSKAARVEFLTTAHYIEKYLKDGDKILDIGAGAGEYSLYFARKGYEVSALELADANIAAFKKKLTPEDKIDLVQGNALDLSRYADKSFDNGRRKAVIISPSEASRKVALRVGIYKEYLLAESCKPDTQIDRCGRFACAAFLIADSNGFTVWHFAFPPSY